MASLSQKVQGIERYTIPSQYDLLTSNIGLREGNIRKIITVLCNQSMIIQEMSSQGK